MKFSRALVFTLCCLIAGTRVMSSCSKPSGEIPESTGHAHGIIPLPEKVELKDGSFTVDKYTVLVNNPALGPALQVAGQALTDALGTITQSDLPGPGRFIRFRLDPQLPGDKYILDIGTDSLVILAGSAASAYYAAQSLGQMIRNATGSSKTDSFSLRQMKITDQPLYEWRGFHLDLSRHFFSSDYLKVLIDRLAIYKFNKLHLHLTDDQGWRVESQLYPLLNETGSWRKLNHYDTICLQMAQSDPDYQLDSRFLRTLNGELQYGGYLTKQELAEIIDYAAQHYIEVIPEIDMPGHMSAAIAAYPYLSCVDSAGWGTEFSYPVCPCNPQVMNFAMQIWDELLEIFPSTYVHVGCDEVEKGTWSSSPSCQQFMQEQHMTAIEQVQDYFLEELRKHLEAKGKTVIAWDDVIEGTIDPGILTMYWRDWVEDSPERCVANGNKVILTPAYPFYFASINTDQALEDLYNYNPTSGFDPSVAKEVIGLQSCMWTEVIPSEAVFEKTVFPRLQALSEVCWSSTRDWTSFKSRMSSHFTYMNRQGIRYKRPGWVKE